MLDFGYYNMDCMDGMKQFPDKYFDLAIVDPVYGDVKVGGYMTGKTKAGVGPYPEYDYSIWNQKKTDESYFKELFRVSKKQIIFGGNYFSKEIGKDSPCWIVWDKCNGNTNWADCELAWTSFNTAVRMFRFMWNGMLQGKSIEHGEIMQGRKELNEKRIHPTQKPVALYKWILQNYANKGDKLLDTHVGSGSSIIAFEDLGFKYVAFEKESSYFQKSSERIRIHKSQITLFDIGMKR